MGSKTVSFKNVAPHRAYVDNPESDNPNLTLIRPGVVVDAPEDSGFYRELEANPQMAREGTEAFENFEPLPTAEIGPAAFPVPEEERVAEPSGLHITGKDSGVPVAADTEPTDHKDGTGEDDFEGIAAVRDGEVVRGDVPLASQDEETAPPVDHPEESTSEQSEAVAEPRRSGTVTTEDVPAPDTPVNVDDAGPQPTPETAAPGESASFASPAARKAAKSAGLAKRDITPTGNKGKTITVADVKRAKSASS